MKQLLRLKIRGAVQGVGFRPFVYRLAAELELAGWVLNSSQGVFIEVEGPRPALDAFRARLPAERPPLAVLHAVEHQWREPVGFAGFEIRHSDEEGEKTVVVLPDVATCAACLAEVVDPADRRYGYPFTNCTNCGPRFTIVEALPYDRPNTTMRRFPMCASCRREYEQPRDRRFHAQPNACPRCGPQIALWTRGGRPRSVAEEALAAAVRALEDGRILALKGLGGFHLMVDARNAASVVRLRQRKARHGKPLALMVRDLDQARRICAVPAPAAELLTSPQAPIVLLRRLEDPATQIAEEVAPGCPDLGVMLPYTPLHHLLLGAIDFPIVATSGNLTDEPICIDNQEALERLGAIADFFLVHDRPIARHADDSVVWLAGGAPQMIRRARGYAPLPLVLPRRLPTILAVGAHLKNTVALSVDDKVFLSQHLGDLETSQALDAFERVIGDFLQLYEAEPVAIAHDLHPEYLSTRWALANASDAVPLLPVQHHHAHLAACMADAAVADEDERVLGVIWDGTGYGTDGTIWGGEFLLGNAADFTRVAYLRPFLLPGGDAAVREPRRVALALLWELYGDAVLERDELAPIRALGAGERKLLGRMLDRRIHSPATSSMGRLFDGVAALVDLYQQVSFEAQAAMALEFVADATMADAYPIALGSHQGALRIDWQPLLEAILEDSRRGVGVGIIAARFHNALVDAIVDVARAVGEPRVALAGGCFQNRLLTERATERLREAGFEVLLHRQVPANDGSISLGQVAVAAARLAAVPRE